MIPKRASWQQQQQHPQHNNIFTQQHTNTNLHTPTHMQTLPNATAAQLACLLYSSVHLSRLTSAPAAAPAPAPATTPALIVPYLTPPLKLSLLLHLHYLNRTQISVKFVGYAAVYFRLVWQDVKVVGCRKVAYHQSRPWTNLLAKYPSHTHTLNTFSQCVCVPQIFAQHIPSTLAAQIQSVKRAT